MTKPEDQATEPEVVPPGEPVEIPGFMRMDKYLDKVSLDITSQDPLLKETEMEGILVPVVKKRFLHEFEKCGTVDRACATIGISPGTISAWRMLDPLFSEQVNAVRRHKLLPLLEEVAFQRALSGKNDNLLMFLLKAYGPDIFGEKKAKAENEPLTIKMVTARKNLTEK